MNQPPFAMILGGSTHKLTLGYALDFYSPLIFVLAFLFGLLLILRWKKISSPPWLGATTAVILSWVALGMSRAQIDFYYVYPSTRFGLEALDSLTFWFFYAVTYVVTREVISNLTAKQHPLASEWGITLGFCCSGWLALLGFATV